MICNILIIGYKFRYNQELLRPKINYREARQKPDDPVNLIENALQVIRKCVINSDY